MADSFDRPNPDAAPRREPLPWQEPKSAADDPDAPERVRKLLASPTYRPADSDLDFLNGEDTRGVRLEIDYLKAELELRRRGVEHTIVVFGSTRIGEVAAAERRVHELEALLAATPGDHTLEAQLRIAEQRRAKSRYYDVARELGRLVGGCTGGGKDCRVLLMTGGGPGIMEAANRGAHDVGSPSIGLNIALPHEQFPNPYISPELCFRFHYFAMRKLHFLLRARALVAFPGGYGTFDEVFETLTLVQSRTIAPVPVVLVGESYWRRAVDFDFLVGEGVIEPEDRELFWYAESADEIWRSILSWHDKNGTPLLTPCGP
ncbi:MAG TPA: LOG family protein [Gammaproteobacteria bacterium]|nr:LOG family protein [Gammaproteobacteria bacterium]